MIAFGPVPSRRLGQSLGINNIPPKHCSYDCVYCQVGPTTHNDLTRRTFFTPTDIFQSVKQRVEEVQTAGGHIDYLTIVPDGEPTLDIHLTEIIELLRPLGIKIAVITNASMLWREDVRAELRQADCVSLKVDSVDEVTWRKVNRPNPDLSLPAILEGALAFDKTFQGLLITETMLVRGINDHPASVQATAQFLGQLQPDVAYLAAPTRPPSEGWAQAPTEATLTQAYQIFVEAGVNTEVLIGYSADTFTAGGDVVQNLLSITSVHPMRESEALDFLRQGNLDALKLQELVEEEQLVRVVHEGIPFYVRKLGLEKE